MAKDALELGEEKQEPIIYEYKDHIKPNYKDQNCIALRSTTNDYELYFFLEGGHNGEKVIYIELNGKTIILALDLIQDLVQYFRKPFNHSEKVNYWYDLKYNNFAPMNLTIKADNISVVLLEDYTSLDGSKKGR